MTASQDEHHVLDALAADALADLDIAAMQRAHNGIAHLPVRRAALPDAPAGSPSLTPTTST